MSTIAIAERGCGWPKEGGMYFAIGMGPDGIPPEEFLLDPLIPIPSDVVIKNRGLTLMEVEGIWHIIDHVGKPYHNAADWFEEVKRLGFHQRIETTLDFSKLDRAKSRYFVVHNRVIPGIEATQNQIYDVVAMLDTPVQCPKHNPDHNVEWGGLLDHADTEACAELLWTDLIKAEMSWKNKAPDLDMVQRIMPSFEYYGYSLRYDVKWESGFFASFPISMMQTLIYKGSMGEHEESAARAVKNGWKGEIEYIEL